MKIICIGRNYRKHIEELNNEKPTSPVIFIKPDSSIILKNQPFFIPDFTNDVHYETEVILKICKLGKSIDKNINTKRLSKAQHFILKKNGSDAQVGNTSYMLWGFDELISEISKFFTLKIGDVIFTGTPSGVNSVCENDLFEGFIEKRNVFKRRQEPDC